ncbi:hypothetical protein [Clostridium cochlearium]|nr:hypothetical protein [Clostridium cochlearium]
MTPFGIKINGGLRVSEYIFFGIRGIMVETENTIGLLKKVMDI